MARVATPQIVEAVHLDKRREADPQPQPWPQPRPQAVLLDLRRESLVDSTLFDIRGLVIDILTNDPKLAVDTMIEMGRRTLQPTHTSARPHLDLGFSSARRDLDAISTQSRGHLEVISRPSRVGPSCSSSATAAR